MYSIFFDDLMMSPGCYSYCILTVTHSMVTEYHFTFSDLQRCFVLVFYQLQSKAGIIIMLNVKYIYVKCKYIYVSTA